MTRLHPLPASLRKGNYAKSVKKSLSVRTHRCTCGYVAGRDENAAQNILLKGYELFKQTYRSWEWKRGASPKPASASETEGQQEAGKPAPPLEHSDRSRRMGDVFPLSAPQTPSNPDTALLPLDELPLFTRAPSAESLSSDFLNSSKGKNKKKRKPAQTIDESFVQLTLWDLGAETDTGG